MTSKHDATIEGRPSPDAPAADVSLAVRVAVVHAAGEICHVAVAASEEALARRLGDYVRQHAWYQLRPEDGERVLDLLEDGRAGDAVRLYFSTVGERWDREELDVREVPLAPPPDGGGR